MDGKADVAKESGKIEKAGEPKTIRRIQGTQGPQLGEIKPHCPGPSIEGGGDDGDDGDDDLLGLTEEDDWLEADEAFLEEEETRDSEGDGSDDKGIVEILESDPIDGRGSATGGEARR
ncbi:hypothetical protein BGX21_006043 [Mortierella sp. AD011]|nr:hypothetical protein BGX21_006043 [Mortierella sp. AD011]